MSDYDAATYGDRIAEVYDAWYPGSEAETRAAVDFLAGAADAGPVLELGIGTGRIAIPLAEKGLRVLGIEASEAMIGRLRAKPGSDRIQVVMGDFADADVEGEFSLVFVAFNTFFALLNQEDQVRCFRNVAGRLRPGGRFVLECFVPDLGRFDRNQRLAVTRLEGNEMRLEASLYDPIGQRVDSRHVILSEGGVRFFPVQVRYAWPAELDLMARLAGMRLRERWAGWRREPFTPQSSSHVSVYERADA